LKITNLLAQYLYFNKRLDLPGIGTFLLNESFTIETEKTKQSKLLLLEGASFQDNRYVKEDDKLIAFIAENSGKIKALAAADLNSHLELDRQFLNIGKPFLFEGIGTLVKKQSGEFNFTPGHVLIDKQDNIVARDYGKESLPEENIGDYKSIFYTKSDSPGWKKTGVIILILAGFLLAIWGGYTIYKNRQSNDKDSVVIKTNSLEQKDEITPKNDSIPGNISHVKDTISLTLPVTKAGYSKFILEKSPKTRALYRYQRLKTFQWPVQMETRDSTEFTIYMLLQVAPADTSSILDSLSRLNGKRVHILK
jgi:hypothetical protein